MNNKKKTQNVFKGRMKRLFIVLAVSMITLGTITYSSAYLTWTNDNPLVNLFTRSNVDIEIVEDFDDEVKKNILVENKGNIDVYVRVKLNASWLQCETEILDDCTQSGILADDVVIDVPADWILINGIYYYKHPVPKGEVTSLLVGEEGILPPAKPHESLRYKLDVITSSVQANPVNAVEYTWNVKVVNKEIVGEQ